MTNMSVPFLALLPVGHRVRSYRAERYRDGEWLPAGSPSVLCDLDTGVVFASTKDAERFLKNPGEPKPDAADLRLIPVNWTVAYCQIRSSGGEFGELVTELGLLPEGASAPYR